MFVSVLSRHSGTHLFHSLCCCMSVRGHLSRLSGAIRSLRENYLVISSGFNLCWIEYDSAPWKDTLLNWQLRSSGSQASSLHTGTICILISTQLNYFESSHISSTQCFHPTSASSFIKSHYFGRSSTALINTGDYSIAVNPSATSWIYCLRAEKGGSWDSRGELLKSQVDFRRGMSGGVAYCMWSTLQQPLQMHWHWILLPRATWSAP